MAVTESLNVLETSPPRFSPEEVASIAADLFDLHGEARDLGSERDQTFLVGDGVLKISNTGEDPAVLDLEAKALAHIERIDPELPIARQRGSATYEGHFVRLFDRMTGRSGARDLDDDAVFAFAATNARLTLALRGFFHPAAGRDLLWNPGQAARLRPLIASIPDAGRRAIVERALDRYEERVLPGWDYLPAQVVHGDFTLDNVLVDERGRVSGITDFGDLGFGTRAGDLAIDLCSILRVGGAELFRTARIAIDGYQSRIPLEGEELDVLGDLVFARLAALVAISAWRVERYPENAVYIQSWDDESWSLLEEFDALGFEAVARELGAPQPPVPTGDLLDRRSRALGAALTGLTYRNPVHVVRAEGVWLFDADGRPVPRRLQQRPRCRSLPPACDRGGRPPNAPSEHALSLPVRAARRAGRASGRHDAARDGARRCHARQLGERGERPRVAAGDDGDRSLRRDRHGVRLPRRHDRRCRLLSGGVAGGVQVRARGDDLSAWGRDGRMRSSGLDARGHGLGATYLDCGFTSDGIWTPAADDVQAIARATREAGGLLVADEVQAGHGRTGEHLWSFVQYGIVPDVVTLGKPMGNGYPVAAVIARQELFDRLKAETEVFSTFGGNPVAARAALAVLDVIDDERLIENAKRVGEELRTSLADLGIGEVRGRGLLVGVELDSAERAEETVNRMRDAGVLINRTGPKENVLKIRPPLVFGTEHVELLREAIGQSGHVRV